MISIQLSNLQQIDSHDTGDVRNVETGKIILVNVIDAEEIV